MLLPRHMRLLFETAMLPETAIATEHVPFHEPMCRYGRRVAQRFSSKLCRRRCGCRHFADRSPSKPSALRSLSHPRHRTVWPEAAVLTAPRTHPTLEPLLQTPNTISEIEAQKFFLGHRGAFFTIFGTCNKVLTTISTKQGISSISSLTLESEDELEEKTSLA